MEIIVIILIGLTIYIIYAIYSNKKNKENLIIQEQEQEESTKLFVDEFQRIGEQYEDSGIPTIDSDISLKKTETLHVRFHSAQWMEYRKKRTGTVVHGITARVKITKGLYYRAGTGQMSSESIDQLTPIDKGDLYFTNKGILFRGTLGNKTVPYNKIIMLTPFPQGLKIERDSGKDVYIPYAVQPHQAAAIALLWDKERTA